MGFSGISILAYIFLFFKNIKKVFSAFKNQSKYIIFYITAYAAVIFLFITAPDVRYGSSFFVLFLLLHIIPALMVLTHKTVFRLSFKRIYCLLIVFFMISFEVFLFNRYFFTGRVNLYGTEKTSIVLHRLVLPAEYPLDSENYRTLMLTSGTYSFPAYLHGSDSCWYSPFPSIPEVEFNNSKPVLRGPSVLSGFKSE